LLCEPSARIVWLRSLFQLAFKMKASRSLSISTGASAADKDDDNNNFNQLGELFGAFPFTLQRFLDCMWNVTHELIDMLSSQTKTTSTRTIPATNVGELKEKETGTASLSPNKNKKNKNNKNSKELGEKLRAILPVLTLLSDCCWTAIGGSLEALPVAHVQLYLSGSSSSSSSNSACDATAEQWSDIRIADSVAKAAETVASTHRHYHYSGQEVLPWPKETDMKKLVNTLAKCGVAAAETGSAMPLVTAEAVLRLLVRLCLASPKRAASALAAVGGESVLMMLLRSDSEAVRLLALRILIWLLGARCE
jgi:hypothetical protein